MAFLLPARGAVSQWVTLPLILMATGLFKWATGFWGYSGKSGIDPIRLLWSDMMKVVTCHRNMEISKHKDIGWRLLPDCLYRTGTSMIWSGGVWTTLR